MRWREAEVILYVTCTLFLLLTDGNVIPEEYSRDEIRRHDTSLDGITEGSMEKPSIFNGAKFLKETIIQDEEEIHRLLSEINGEISIDLDSIEDGKSKETQQDTGRENHPESRRSWSERNATMVNWGVTSPSEKECEVYLTRYGYLSSGGMANEVAVKKMAFLRLQRNYKLPESGECDEETKEFMNLPRCGVTDIDKGLIGRSRRKRYVLSGTQWPTRMLKYSIANYGSSLSMSQTNTIIARALKFWSDASGLMFFQVQTYNDPDFTISFFKREHNTGMNDTNFDGPRGILAHAFEPPVGDVHLDDDEDWTIQSTSGVNLLQVVTHELGHSLGLNHSFVEGSIMTAAYSGYSSEYELHHDDIAGIQAIYGIPDIVDGVYVGNGGSYVFSDVATSIEMSITLDPSTSACSSNIQSRESELCDAIKTIGTSRSIQINNCRIERVIRRMTAYLMMDIIPPRSGTTLSRLASYINANTLSQRVDTCEIVSTTFSDTPYRCPSSYTRNCENVNAECVPLTTGFTCVCHSGYRNVASSGEPVQCPPNGRITRGTVPRATTTPRPPNPGLSGSGLGVSTYLIIGLAIGLVLILVLIMICLCSRGGALRGGSRFGGNHRSPFGMYSNQPTNGYPNTSPGVWHTKHGF